LKALVEEKERERKRQEDRCNILWQKVSRLQQAATENETLKKELEAKQKDIETLREQTSKSEAIDSGVDKTGVAQLMDMGFTAERAKKALIINKNNIHLASEWLLAHERDVD